MGSVNFDRAQSSGDAYRSIGKAIYDELEYEKKKKREDEKYEKEVKDKSVMTLHERCWKGGAEAIGAGENPEVNFETIRSGEMKFKPKPTPKESVDMELLRARVLQAMSDMARSKGKETREEKALEFKERKLMEENLNARIKEYNRLKGIFLSAVLNTDTRKELQNILSRELNAINEEHRSLRRKDYLSLEEPVEPVKKAEEKKGFFEKIFKKDKNGKNAAKEGNNEFEFMIDANGNRAKVYKDGRVEELSL
jgi:hypothetical protein